MFKSSEFAPEVALFVRLAGNITPLKICYESASISLENGEIEIDVELKVGNRAFIVRSGGLIKAIWPNQSIQINYGESAYELYVKKCLY